ncbi:MAG: transketolase family protein [Lachnospiraceae bacterium]|nr:transketolase family protein [Lachnospiraceae bacterium]
MSELKRIATRQSYGEALAEIGETDERIVVLDADLAASTKTAIFGKKFPDRFIDCGIAEANMISMAAGLATCGKIPFCSSFAMFATGRAYEQIRNSVAYSHLNVRIAASHAGISVGEDGATHQCIEDIALMRNIPGMTVLCPADDLETKECIKACMEIKGPCYIRLGRLAVPAYNTPDNYEFNLFEAPILRDGSDVTLFATGLEVIEALQAADMLAEDGISAQVVNVHTIKPLDEETVVACAKKTGAVVTIEEHTIIGGLGSAVAETLSEQHPTRQLRIGIKDRFGESGPALKLLEKFELDAKGIYKQVKDFL